jgi:FKBP-type peptidyl-prolyl cis-trans isomerase (trigger factor)
VSKLHKEIEEVPSLTDITRDGCSYTGQIKFSSNYMNGLLKNLLKLSRGKNLDLNKMLYNQLQETINNFLRNDPNAGKLFGNAEIDLRSLNLMSSLHSDLDLKIHWESFPDLPEIDLGKIKIEDISVESFADEDIKNIESSWLGQKSTLEDYDGPIEKGDIVVTHWSIEDNDKAEEIPIQIGVRPRLDRSLEKKFIGLKVGDTISHDFQIPQELDGEQYAQYASMLKGFAGQKIDGTIKIVSVKRFVKPELTEDLIKESNFESEEAFKKELTDRLTEMVKETNMLFAREQIMVGLRDYSFGIPSSYINQNIEFIIKNWCAKFRMPYGSHTDKFKEEFMSHFSKEVPECKSFDEFMTNAEGISKKNACAHFMVETVVSKIGLSDEDLNGSIMQSYFSLPRNKSMDDFQKIYYDLRELVILNKFAEYLKNNGMSTEKKVHSLKELQDIITQFRKRESSPYTDFNSSEDEEQIATLA